MTTPKAKLHELTLTTAQQATTVNADLSIIDQGIDGTVKSRGVNTPPGSPSDGDAYIVGTSPTGVWAGKGNQIAFWRNSAGAWQFMTPLEGWTRRVQDDDDAGGVPKEYGYTGSAWVQPMVSASFAGGTLSAALNEAPIVTLASASTVRIGAAAANTISISGTTAIIAFDIIAAGAIRRLVFQGALTLTHHSTAQILPTGANITTAAGDVAEFVSLGSGNWRCTAYMRADGTPLAGAGVGGGLANWTDAISTSAPNASIPTASLASTNAATNVDAAIVPKGTGALLSRVPDSTSAGGNKRGTYAVDWQLLRTSAAQVASGNYSTIGGGYRSTASGQYSTIPGGYQCTASGQYTFASGDTCTAMQDYAFAFGSSSSASNTYAISIGFTNSASGVASVALGYNVTASGFASLCVGRASTANADYSVVFGYNATARGIIGYEAKGNGVFSAVGDAQRGRLVMRRSTTTATAAVATSDASSAGATNQIVLPNTSAFKFHGDVVARDSSGNAASWAIKGLIKRGANAAATALVGTPTVSQDFADAGASSWVVAISADTTNGALAVTVTGAASTSIKWVADIETVEVVG